jgi:hypothetical protein
MASTGAQSSARSDYKLLDRMHRDGKLTPDKFQSVISYMTNSGVTDIDALVETGIFEEADLLGYLSKLTGTAFVGTPKLSKARIASTVLEKIPFKLAERLRVFPLMFDDKTQTLSIVCGSLDATELAKQLQFATKIREIKPILARPESVKCAIEKYYKGRANAFDHTLRKMELAEAQRRFHVVDESHGFGLDFGQAASHVSSGPTQLNAPAPPSPRAAQPVAQAAQPPTGHFASTPSSVHSAPAPQSPAPLEVPASSHGPDLSLDLNFSLESSSQAPSIAPFAASPTGAHPSASGAATTHAVASSAPSHGTISLSAPPELDLTLALPTPLPSVPSGGMSPPHAGAEGLARESLHHGFSREQYLASVHAFVSLLDHDRGPLSDHAAKTASLVQAVLAQQGTPADAAWPIVLAAHLHDVGKRVEGSALHLTLFNVSYEPTHQAHAKACYTAVARLFQHAGLPPHTLETLEHQYERYDGQGFPDRLQGQSIPLGARVLGVVESFLDWTDNPNNLYQKKLQTQEALNLLEQLQSSLFDPHVVAWMRRAVTG